ncbi:GNAT family N-acetyltransferase [Kineosporia babensis]|nr:GNAT family N-acetyltransferase [Kineosporia babensis]
MPADRAAIVQTLVAAFAADPLLRAVFPGPAEYAQGAPVFFGYLFDKRVEGKAILTVGGGLSVAIWESPASVGPGLALDLPEPAASRLRAYDEAVHAALPDDPHWYLGVLGTHPEHLGNGFGRAVMAAGLERAAADGLPAYLETTNPGNVPMYERAGWKVTAELDAPMPIWVMTQ